MQACAASGPAAAAAGDFCGRPAAAANAANNAVAQAAAQPPQQQLKEGPDADARMLRDFDITSTYGPCVGITRLERWERAKRFSALNCDPSLEPPEEVKELLLSKASSAAAAAAAAAAPGALGSDGVAAAGLHCVWHGRL